MFKNHEVGKAFLDLLIEEMSLSTMFVTLDKLIELMSTPNEFIVKCMAEEPDSRSQAICTCYILDYLRWVCATTDELEYQEEALKCSIQLAGYAPTSPAAAESSQDNPA